MQIAVVTPADVLPVSLVMAGRHLRALQDETDLVDLYCRAATDAVEDYTGRSLITKTFKIQFERWLESVSRCNYRAPVTIPTPGTTFNRVTGIVLPMSPLVAINSLKYYPSDGSAQVTWATTNYRTDNVSLPGRLVFVDGVTLPALAVRQDAIEIEFTAGYGAKASQMPPMLVMAMLQLARHMLDNPSAVDPEGKLTKMPLSFQYLLRSQRI